MKKKYSIGIEASKIYKQKLMIKIIQLALLLLLVVFSVVYFLVYILYSNGNFIITLDKNAYNGKNVFLSEDGTLKNMKIQLKAKTLDYMDNISVNWIDQNIDSVKTGTHNGNNYIAYTFYVVNGGDETVKYWYQVDISDTIQNVDEAIRVMIYHNGEKTIYAKKSKTTGEAEVGTTKFYSDSIAVVKPVTVFKPDQKDKFTIVVWLEGDDPDCVDSLIGGAVKLKMDISEEHIEKK